MRFVTTLHPTVSYDHGGLVAERDAWAPPALALLIHIRHLRDCLIPVSQLPRITVEAMGKALGMGAQ